MDNNKKKETHLESRLTTLKESKETLRIVLERIQQLELRLSGDRITDLKDATKMCEELDNPKSSIMTDFGILNNDFDIIIHELGESTGHLEELI